MDKRRAALVVLALSCSVCVAFSIGCETHYAMSQPDMHPMAAALADSPDRVDQMEHAITDRDIAARLDADVRAKLPTTLAIAKINSGYSYRYSAGLQTIGAEELNSWEKVVASEPLITGVQPILPIAMKQAKEGEPTTLRALRDAAARQNCELLLVYLQDDTDLENSNNASILYWTIVGLWVVPGTDVEHRTVTQAVLVDTRTGSILGSATGEDRDKRTRPAALSDVNDEKLRQKTAENSLKDLQKGCAKLLRDVVAASRAPSR